MSASGCAREAELLAALARGYIAPELAAHADSCPPCGELQLVATALLDERAAAAAAAPVPAAGTMWWRMRVRERQDAAARVRRTLLFGQAATVLVALALLVALVGPALAAHARALAAAILVSTPLLAALVTLAVVAPLAGWVLLRQK